MNSQMTECYLDISQKVRMMVEDQMQAGDRSGSSALWSESHASQNDIFGLNLNDYCEKMINIEVIYGKTNRQSQGFNLRFCDFLGNKFLECSSLGPIWIINLDNRSNIIQLATDIFKQLLEFYQESVKKLNIGGTLWKNVEVCNFQNVDFGVGKFGSLEDLRIMSDLDITGLLNKIQHPLKKLIIFKEIRTNLADFPQICQVQKTLFAPFLKLSQEQFKRLALPCFEIDIGELTERDVFGFVRSWQDGTIREQKAFYFCRWFLKGSNFNLKKIARLLRAPNHDFDANGELEIQHFYENGKKALLYRSVESDMLTFEAVWDEEELQRIEEEEDQ